MSHGGQIVRRFAVHKVAGLDHMARLLSANHQRLQMCSAGGLTFLQLRANSEGPERVSNRN